MTESYSGGIRARILVVDDDPLLSRSLERYFQSKGYSCLVVDTGAGALAIVDQGVDLLVLDHNLPDMDGIMVTRRLRRRPELHDLPIIMITGDTSHSLCVSALEAGVTEFIRKPFNLLEMGLRSRTMLALKHSQDRLKRQRQILEDAVQQRSAALNHALELMQRQRDELREAQLETLERLALAAEYRDEDTATHIRRVGKLCAVLAEGHGCTPREVELIELASPLHDVGKLGVPDGILMKRGPLDPEERRLMQQHAEIGGRILAGSGSEILRAAEVIARTHHEWWNGEGYPYGLMGERIPLFGRIAAVADVFDALTSERPYKAAFSNERATSIMVEGRGRQFDPRILDLLMGNMNRVVEVQETARVEDAQRLHSEGGRVLAPGPRASPVELGTVHENGPHANSEQLTQLCRQGCGGIGLL